MRPVLSCALWLAACHAPERRALAVVSDFADTSLEAWPGPGFTSVAEIRAQLDANSAHWSLLSRGAESMQWDLVRVQLPQPLVDDAFADLDDFRETVIRLVRSQIDAQDYDVDRDGILDTVWIIASTNGRTAPWLVGGTTRDADANVFVDGQDSLAVTAHATGNFIHEVGHTRGLRDLYGDVATVGDLSDMANSWRMPPGDFCAYDRVRLGWAAPTVLPRGRHTLAASAIDKIATARPDEYFLIEQRDGVIVYHVLETSDQNTDPPLLQIEPAAGTLRDYDGDEVFRIHGGTIDVL